MKRFIAIIALSLAVILTPGCGTLLTKTYSAVQSNPVSVQQSLASWDAYIKTNSNRVTVEQNNKVRDAFVAWRSSQLNVIDSALAYQRSVTSTNGATNAPAIEAIFIGSVTAADSARTNLILLIKQYSK